MLHLIDPPAPATRRHPNLILHCGASAVEFTEVTKIRTPRPTASWHPIPHDQLVRTVERTLATTSLAIGAQAHSLTHDGMRYFGLMEIHGRKSGSDYCWVLGLRNSHDKTFPAGIVAGASVFVCDNLSFSGEVKFARKHTRFIARDLPQLTGRAIGLLAPTATSPMCCTNGANQGTPSSRRAMSGRCSTRSPNRSSSAASPNCPNARRRCTGCSM